MQCIQAREIDVTAIHHVEGTRLEGQQVQHVHVVQLAVADVDEGGNRPAQALSPSELRESHGAELLGARQRAHAGIAATTLHDARKAWSTARRAGGLRHAPRRPRRRDETQRARNPGSSTSAAIGSPARRSCARARTSSAARLPDGLSRRAAPAPRTPGSSTPPRTPAPPYRHHTPTTGRPWRRGRRSSRQTHAPARHRLVAQWPPTLARRAHVYDARKVLYRYAGAVLRNSHRNLHGRVLQDFDDLGR